MEITTVIAITVPISCVISLIIGVLLGAVVHYCAVRMKPTVALSHVREEPDPKYEDVSDLQSRGKIYLKENAAYANVQH